MTMGTKDRHSWPAGLAGMLALVIGVEAGVARNETGLMSASTLLWHQSGRAASGEAAGSEVFCFGDSLVLNGLAPAVIEGRLGKPAYNLAVPRGQAAASLFLLRRVLRGGAQPAAILMDGDALEVDPLEPDLAAAWGALATLPECAELAWNAQDPDAFRALALASAWPTYRRRADIRARVLADLAGTTTPEAPLIDPLRRNLARNRGAYVFPTPGAPVTPDPWPARMAHYRPAGWAAHPLNAGFLVQFLDLTAARKIPVFWLLPPVHPEFQARRDRFGRDAAYAGFVRRLERRYPHLVVIDARHSGYGTPVVYDMMHLNRRGAVAYSDAVARLVGARLAAPGGPRWVDLPAFRDGADAAAVEDLAASGEALRRVSR